MNVLEIRINFATSHDHTIVFLESSSTRNFMIWTSKSLDIDGHMEMSSGGKSYFDPTF